MFNASKTKNLYSRMRLLCEKKNFLTTQNSIFMTVTHNFTVPNDMLMNYTNNLHRIIAINGQFQAVN